MNYIQFRRVYVYLLIHSSVCVPDVCGAVALEYIAIFKHKDGIKLTKF